MSLTDIAEAVADTAETTDATEATEAEREAAAKEAAAADAWSRDAAGMDWDLTSEKGDVDEVLAMTLNLGPVTIPSNADKPITIKLTAGRHLLSKIAQLASLGEADLAVTFKRRHQQLRFGGPKAEGTVDSEDGVVRTSADDDAASFIDKSQPPEPDADGDEE